MKELLTRAITGIVYVGVLIGAIYYHQTSFLLLFLFFGIMGLIEFQKMVKTALYLPYLVLLTGIVLVYLNELTYPAIWIFLVLCLALNSMLIYRMFKLKTFEFSNSTNQLIATTYVSGGFLFLILLAFISDSYQKEVILGAMILIWVNDSFAYLTGRKLGKTKLFPSVSPKKTIEGALGGLIFGIIAALILGQYFTILNTLQWIVLAIVIIVFGTIGDLVESKFKRTAGIKDSGNILPGHGGILDRLDSIFFAAPFVYASLLILNLLTN